MQNKTPSKPVFDTPVLNTQVFYAKAKPKGLVRLHLALINSCRAFMWLFKNEAAFRQEGVVLLFAIPLTFVIDVTPIEQVFLIASVLFVMLIEIINTAIEVIVDRIGLEIHPLSGLAKDLGSAAVSTALMLAALIWFVICFW